MKNIQIKKVGTLPIVHEYMRKLGVYDVLNDALPTAPQSKSNTAEALCILISNIVDSTDPLYHVELWLKDYTDGLHSAGEHASAFNDAKLGRSLDQLFEAPRHELMALLSAKAIEVHELETKALHNDTTTVTLTGEYEDECADAVQPKHGFNKDGHPDCKQIVFGLTTTDDGCIPLHYKAYDGNQSDNGIHIHVWNDLRRLIKSENFIYVSDSKLCTIENMQTIANHGGLFITVVPATRKEVKTFRQRLLSDEVVWTGAYITPNSKNSKEEVLYRFHEDEKSAEGFRIVWVHSSAKKHLETTSRMKKLAQIEEALNELCERLNKFYLKSQEQIEAAVKKILTGCEKFIDVKITITVRKERKYGTPGRPDTEASHKIVEVVNYDIQWLRNEEVILNEEKRDGVFPLITNTTLDMEGVLKQYKKQAFLEKRHSTLKNVLEVAPVYLKKTSRIESVLFLYFIALMVVSLIERRIRLSMKQRGVKKFPMPEQKVKLKAPTWNRINKHFKNVSLLYDEETKKTSNVKGLNDTHKDVLKFLNVSDSTYQDARQNNWWRFDKYSD